MNTKKTLLITSFLLAVICLSGASCGKSKDTIANIPFAVLDQNDFTLEKTAKEITEPMALALDKQELFDKFYQNIRKKTEEEKITINSNKELVLIALRGKNGSCDNADITLKKISQEKKKLKLEVAIDNNEVNLKKCDLLMNPYFIVKVDKEKINYNKNLKIELINSANGSIISTADINNLPGIFK